MGLIVFTPEVAAWVGRNGLSMDRDASSGRVVVQDSGGEIRFFLDSLSDGSITVTKSERAGTERWECDLASTDALNRYFVELCGNSVRLLEGLPGLLKLSIRMADIAPHASLRVVPGFENEELRREELMLHGSLVGVFKAWGSDSHWGVKASQYCSVSVKVLMDAYLSGDGAPFGLR